MNHAERRHAPRLPVLVDVEQHVEGQRHVCRATDLSLTGMYMQRPIGSFVRHSATTTLAIRLPDGDSDPLWASAEVVYDCFDAQFHGSAVRFTAMSERDRARLGTFLRGPTDGPNRSSAHAA
jgi:PilZ domain